MLLAFYVAINTRSVWSLSLLSLVIYVTNYNPKTTRALKWLDTCVNVHRSIPKQCNG